MSHRDLEPVARESGDITAERLEALRDLFPEAFGEDGLDFERLRATLGDFVDDSPERYQFTWSGKRDAIRAFQVPSRATLAPDRDNSVNWDDTGHVFIEGENLEVLKLLYKSYFGRVKCIYIDPPYNTGNDFVYPDDYADPLEQYLRVTGQRDSEGNLLTSNPETSGRYHSAWLSMMYPRLFLARQLLREDGVIFVSIDDNEVHNLRMLMNEVFGEENFVATVCWQKKYSPANDRADLSDAHEFVLVYARERRWTASGRAAAVLSRLPRGEEQNRPYANPDNDPRGPWKPGDYTCNKSAEQRPNLYYAIVHPRTGEEVWPSRTRVWAYGQEQHKANEEEGRVWWGPNQENRVPAYKRFLSEVPDLLPTTWWGWSDVGHTDEARKETQALFPGTPRGFETAKPVRLMRRIVAIGAGPSTQDDNARPIVMDFFAGSCTTAQAVIEEASVGARLVMVQLPEPLDQPQTLDDGTVLRTIADIGRERIRRVIARMQERDSGTLDISDRETPEDLGFRAYRLVPSNYRPESEAGDAGDASVLFTQPLTDDWTPDGLLHEIALKEGFDLGVGVEKVAGVTENTVYRLTDPYKEQTCLVCLDETLSADTAKALGLTREDLFICLDSALDDTLAANLALQCRLKVI